MRGKREALRSREGAARFGQNKNPVTGRLQGFLLRQDSGNHTIRRFLPPSGGVGARWVQTSHHLVFWYFIFILIKMKE